MKIRHRFDIQKCWEHIEKVRSQCGIRGWQTKEGEVKRYQGFSLTCNPNNVDNIDPNYSTLGTPRNKSSEFFYESTAEFPKLQNSYFDTNSFCQRTPASEMGYIKQVMDSFKRSITRSRVMGIIGAEVDDQQLDLYQQTRHGDSRAGWHRDEPVHECFRINIPILSSDEFMFEMEGEAPYPLEVGYLYTWDTNKPHRVYASRRTERERWSIVIGCNPWFDYIEGKWVKNKFHGQDPFQMLLDGHIIDPESLIL